MMADLPFALVDAVRDQRAVLFFGAGANHGANHPKNHKIPIGNDLRDLISDKYFNGTMKSKSLMSLSAFAANEVGLVSFQKYVRDLLEPFEPAEYHKLLPSFRWKAIATTNYDLIVERAYSAVKGRLQELIPSFKDNDGYGMRSHEATHPLGYYKLHGCIDHYTDESIPLILSNEQYASYAENRGRFYDRLRDLGNEFPFVFAGYSISDAHIQQILFDLTQSNVKRPMFYSISPDFEDAEIRYWASHRVQCIKSTLEGFLQELDRQIPAIGRQIPVQLGGGALSIRSHYRVPDAIESPTLVAYLETDATHVHPGMAAQAQKARDFYTGRDEGWGAIQQNLDVKRTVADSVLVDAVLVADADRAAELFMLKGPAGNGKSVALKRIAWEAAAHYDALAIYSNNSSALRSEPIEEMYRLTGKRLLLCVDHVAIFRTELHQLLKDLRARKIPVTVLGTERDNEWNIYCEQLESFTSQEFPVRYLNEREVGELITLLDRHNSLGVLKEQDDAARLYAFSNAAERQLLVALHEVTLGIPFEDIVFDEYRRIEPPAAREIYLAICALHQFGAPVRAGLISRVFNIDYNEFQTKFLTPLENVVIVFEDRHTGDLFYKSRHQHVAEMVFRRALSKEEDKFDLLSKLVSEINVDYSSDRETFSRLIRGRGIVDVFSSADLGRLFYDRVDQASQDDPFVFHQRAVFELQHPGGALGRAEAAARRAGELNPRSHGIRNTQAEVARRLANDTNDPLKKEAFRRFARDRLAGNASHQSEYDLYTRARLAIDEVIDELQKTDADSKGNPSSRLIETVKAAESMIERALQSFPESAEILSAEANLRDALDQATQAQAALEKAFRGNPRQDWLAVRLARRYRDAGDVGKAAQTLDICLKENPSSKAAHFEYARLLQATDKDGQAIIEHLRRSFSEGDNNYEAQFWYARELFIQSKFADSEKIFRAINDRAPGRFRNGSSANVHNSEADRSDFSGKVERLEEGYGFVRCAIYPSALFASRADSDSRQWATLRNGSNVVFNIAFNRRGARAVALAQTQR